MLNLINLMGRFVRDPELRYTQNNIPVTTFTMAVERDFSGKAETKTTDFIDCVAWNATAEFVHKYFTKGSLAVVSGSLNIRNWEDKQGNKRRSAEVQVRNIYFAGSKEKAVDIEPDMSELDDDAGGDLPF